MLSFPYQSTTEKVSLGRPEIKVDVLNYKSTNKKHQIIPYSTLFLSLYSCRDMISLQIVDIFYDRYCKFQKNNFQKNSKSNSNIFKINLLNNGK